MGVFTAIFRFVRMPLGSLVPRRRRPSRQLQMVEAMGAECPNRHPRPLHGPLWAELWVRDGRIISLLRREVLADLAIGDRAFVKKVYGGRRPGVVWGIAAKGGSRLTTHATGPPSFLKRSSRRRAVGVLLLLALVAAGCAAPRSASEPLTPMSDAGAETDDDPLGGAWGDGEEQADTGLRDPLEEVNRFLFRFNDRIYVYVMKPVATEWKRLVPEDARVGIRNFFSNVETPVRLVNCLLQGKFEGTGIECRRFLINSTVGVAGIGDPALTEYGLRKRNEDFGQTLAVWGLEPGPYLCLPFIGPSCCRDAGGFVADWTLDPVRYVVHSWPIRAGLGVLQGVNSASLHLGRYERLKGRARDPYVALRDAYGQRRLRMIEE